MRIGLNTTRSQDAPVAISKVSASQLTLISTVAFLASLGLLWPAYWYSTVVGIVGAALSIYLLITTFFQFLRSRRSLGNFMLALGSVFWFWIEILTFSLSRPSFPSIAHYAPFSGAQIPVDTVAQSIFCVAVFNICALAVLGFFGSKKLRFGSSVTRGGTNPIFVDLTLLAFSLLGWWPFLRTFGGVQQALQSMLLMRAEVVEFEAGFANYLPILSITAGGFALVRIATQSSASKILTIAAVLAGGTLALLSGTRFKLAYLLLPAVLARAVYAPGYSSFLRNAGVLLAVATTMLLVASYQFTNRYGGDGSEISLITAAFAGAGHFTPLTHAIELLRSPWTEPFMQPMAPLFVTDFIPRFLWPDKPSHEYWEYYNSAIAIAGNVTPSVIGQYFLNWGLPGAAIAGAIFGAWAYFGDMLVEQYHHAKNHLYLALAAFVFTFLFLSYRVYSPNYFAYLLVMIFFFKLFRLKFRLRNRQ